jgi:hypothetical protein
MMPALGDAEIMLGGSMHKTAYNCSVYGDCIPVQFTWDLSDLMAHQSRQKEAAILDRKMGMLILKYYAHQAAKVMEYSNETRLMLSDEEILTAACYLMGTITSELRHSCKYCDCVPPPGLEVLEWLLENDVIDPDRNPCSSAERPVVIDNSIEIIKQLAEESSSFPYTVARLLVSAAYVFSAFECGSFGGSSWAYCALVSSSWMGQVASRHWAEDLTWEMMLNAQHNNARWMDKIGFGHHVLRAMTIGANYKPQAICTLWDHIESGGNYVLRDIKCGRSENDWDRAIAVIGKLEKYPTDMWVTNELHREYCEHCGMEIDNCECCYCDYCGNVEDNCCCGYCDECETKLPECTCPTCEYCGEKESQCDCTKCDACGEKLPDCECEKCILCGKPIGMCHHICHDCGGYRYEYWHNFDDEEFEGFQLCRCHIVCSDCGRPQYRGCVCPTPVIVGLDNMVTFQMPPYRSFPDGTTRYVPDWRHVNYISRTLIDWPVPADGDYQTGWNEQPWWGQYNRGDDDDE